jgi:hypothetical protein
MDRTQFNNLFQTANRYAESHNLEGANFMEATGTVTTLNAMFKGLIQLNRRYLDRLEDSVANSEVDDAGMFAGVAPAQRINRRLEDEFAEDMVLDPNITVRRRRAPSEDMVLDPNITVRRRRLNPSDEEAIIRFPAMDDLEMDIGEPDSESVVVNMMSRLALVDPESTDMDISEPSTPRNDPMELCYDTPVASGPRVFATVFERCYEHEMDSLHMDSCGVCFSFHRKRDVYRTSCGHWFCKSCFVYLQEHLFSEITCPTCREVSPELREFVAISFQNP